MLALETIDLNGSQTFYSLSDKLNLNEILKSKVCIWKLRNNNPMRKSFINNNIKLKEFDALIRLTSEMSKYLYPYIRDILKSRDELELNPTLWKDFKNRFIDLISERFNINSMRVKNLLDPSTNDEIFIRLLLTLALSISDDGYQKLRNNVLNL